MMPMKASTALLLVVLVSASSASASASSSRQGKGVHSHPVLPQGQSLPAVTAATSTCTVFNNNGDLTITAGVFTPTAPNAVAAARFQDTLDTVGWGVLDVVTGASGSDEQKFQGAGMAEGFLTRERLYQQYLNIYEFFFPAGQQPPVLLYTFLNAQTAWTDAQIAEHTKQPRSPVYPFWQGVNLIQNQFTGLDIGYNYKDAHHQDNFTQLPKFAFQMLNGVGDFLDLLSALSEQHRPKFEQMTKKELLRYVGTHGMCSAMIKVNGDLSEMWTAHSSWFTFGSMNRIYKHYNFESAAAPFIASKRVSFSSYPGFLESLDDFYIMSNHLVMVQTTNSIFNQDLYKKVHPNSLFAWQRVRLACQNANNGEEWSKIIATHNSGTYNNQYMVVDYNKFKKGEALLPGTLWVSEQIPGLVEYADVTDQLERGYWASYNVPYFKSIYDQSGYPEYVAKYGVSFSYQLAPRAQIFRRDAGTVVDMNSFKAIMRYNDYKNDPYSKGDPGNAICSRFDLEAENPAPFGCYDTKVTCSEFVPLMKSQAINGPTQSHGIPAFKWSENKTFESTPHYGQPNVFDFDFVTMQPFQ